MNKTLSALMTKLQWQLNELNQQLLVIEQELKHLEQQVQENQQTILNASKTPAYILPEREIAGLHFIMAQQQQQDELKASRTDFLTQQSTFTAKKIRLEMELKMLEKHQENQLKAAYQQALLTEQNNTDEWVLQRRNPA